MHAWLVCYRPLAEHCFSVPPCPCLIIARWFEQHHDGDSCATARRCRSPRDEEVERDEPEAYQRKRHGIALQDSTEVEALDVVLRLIGNVKSAVAVVVRRCLQRDRCPPERSCRPSAVGAAATGRRSIDAPRSKASVHPSSVRATQSCNRMVRYRVRLRVVIAGIESQRALSSINLRSVLARLWHRLARSNALSCPASQRGCPLKREHSHSTAMPWHSAEDDFRAIDTSNHML